MYDSGPEEGCVVVLSPIRPASLTTTDALLLTPEVVADLVARGGYVHPLFTGDGTPAPGRVPLPGPALLLLAGGLVERSGVLDDSVAMVGLEDVRFHAMVFAGDAVRVEIEPGEVTATRGGAVLQRFIWRIRTDEDSPVANLTAIMMMNERSGPSCAERS